MRVVAGITERIAAFMQRKSTSRRRHLRFVAMLAVSVAGVAISGTATPAWADTSTTARYVVADSNASDASLASSLVALVGGHVLGTFDPISAVSASLTSL